MQFVSHRLRIRVDHDVNVSRAQAPTKAEEAKWKTSRQLKPIDQHVTARRKKLLDSLLRRGMMRHVTKVSE